MRTKAFLTAVILSATACLTPFAVANAAPVGAAPAAAARAAKAAKEPTRLQPVESSAFANAAADDSIVMPVAVAPPAALAPSQGRDAVRPTAADATTTEPTRHQAVVSSASASAAADDSLATAVGVRGDVVLRRLALDACADLSVHARTVSRRGGERAEARRFFVSRAACERAARRARVRRAAFVLPASAGGAADGTLIGRTRLVSNNGVALDLIAYASDNLVVGGLLCYPDDGQAHSTVLHVPGGLGGVFAGNAGDLVQTCIDWAGLHGRTAFAPSLRGNDGGEGTPELCLGEADDVVAAATMVRTLEVVDGTRLGLVGGSIGGCVALRAAPRIPNLKAVVAFVPPISLKDVVNFHRTAWQPGVENLCGGGQQEWNTGGPAFADALDSVICGHAQCSDADYNARSPLAYINVQTAPTLIVAADQDNIVPASNEMLYSLFRQGTGHPVSVAVVDECDAPGTPPAVQDVLIVSRGSFHLLAAGPISSGLLFLMAQMDATPTAAARENEGSAHGNTGSAASDSDSDDDLPLLDADAPPRLIKAVWRP